MMTAYICEKFGWTYDEFGNQPQFFIDLIIQKIKVDGQRESNNQK